MSKQGGFLHNEENTAARYLRRLHCLDNPYVMGKYIRMQGTVISGARNIFEVECEDSVLRFCTIKGKKLKNCGSYYNPLAPGDLVQVEADALNQGYGQITGLVPRKNQFVRWSVKGRAPQLLAANTDFLLCVAAPDEPPFRPRFVDRLLAQAEYAGLAPVIVCNKYDLGADMDTEYRLTEWENLGYTVFRVSARSGEGIAGLASFISGKLCALVGQSGVGKTSLVNMLDPSFSLRTGALSEKYGRGTHTTTKGVLLHLNLQGYCGSGSTAAVIDTPGVRRFVLHDIAPCDLVLYFREMKPLAGTCAFGMSCTHRREPGCRILEAVHAGVISEDRYESWRRICDELSGTLRDG